jgi:hypothetical protein
MQNELGVGSWEIQSSKLKSQNHNYKLKTDLRLMIYDLRVGKGGWIAALAGM